VTEVSRARKIFDWVVGIALIAVGVVGLVLPGIQGILMIAAGLAVLSSHSPLARRWNARIKDTVAKIRDRIAR